VIRNASRTWNATTINISENGAQLLMEGSFPNLPDVIDLDIYGDTQRHATVNARIMRVEPEAEDQTKVSVNFVDMTQAQADALSLVIYSDVNQWYSQSRENVDHPIESLRFLASGVIRAFQDLKPADSTTVRKQVRAIAELYWNGYSYPATARELSSSSIRVEVDANAVPNLQVLQRANQPVGIRISRYEGDPNPERLIAQVETIQAPQDGIPTTAVEMIFPRHLEQQQGNKIRQLLRTL
jgi:cellulose synthase (UDP-forming)